MSIVCNPKNYLKENHADFYKLLKKLCIDPKGARGILIPPKSEIDRLNKEYLKANKKNSESRNIYIKVGRTLSMYLLKRPIEEGFEGGYIETVMSKLGLKVYPVKSGKFVVESGEGYSTKSNGKLLEVYGKPSYKEDKFLEFSVATLDSALAFGTPDYNKELKLEGGHMEMVESKEAKDIKQFLAMQFDDQVKMNCKKNYYISTIAGLMKCAELCNMTADLKAIANYCYESPAATFYILLQPFSRSQIVSDELIQKWCGAPYYPSNFDEHRNEFCKKYCTNKEDSERTSMLQANEFTSMNDFKNTVIETYVEHYKSSDFNPMEKLWADEFAFQMDRCEKGKPICDCLKTILDIARSYPGNDYKSELLTTTANYPNLDKSNFKSHITHFKSGKYFMHCMCSGSYQPGDIPTKSCYIESLLRLNS